MADGKAAPSPAGSATRESGARPGAGRGGELDKALRDDGAAADPALDPAVPGFTPGPDAAERAVEGEGVAEARTAIEDLPRQG